MILEVANKKQLEHWDAFVDNSINGTIFHKQKFLAYHGNKFKDMERHLVILKGTTVYAQISLAVDETTGRKVARSPYGGSYGGFIFKNMPTYQIGNEIVKLFLEYLEENNVDECVLTHPILCCCKKPMDGFYFNLLENGFYSSNRDISTVKIFEDLPVEQQVTASVRSQIKLAMKKDIRINRTPNLNSAYEILHKEQEEKFHKEPTHTLDEFLLLHKLFPEEIHTITAELQDRVVAGITCFQINANINSSFYIYFDEAYKSLNAVRPLILHELVRSKERGCHYFDFGTSSLNMQARTHVFAFKEGFAREGGMFRESFCWKR